MRTLHRTPRELRNTAPMTDKPNASHPPKLSRLDAKKLSRQKLLNAALELLVEQGFENLTTGRVAKRAGMAQPSFYVHFEDMNELLVELSGQVSRELRSGMALISLSLREGGDLLDVTQRCVELALHTIVKHQKMLRIFMAEQAHAHSSIGSRVRAGMDVYMEELVDDFHSFPPAKGVPRERVRMFADLVIATMAHTGLAVADGRYTLDTDLVGRVSRGILAWAEVLAAPAGDDRPHQST